MTQVLRTLEALNGFRPKYISDLLPHYEPPRPLRSSGSGLLSVPWVITKHGEAAVIMHYISGTKINKRLWKCRKIAGLSPLVCMSKCSHHHQCRNVCMNYCKMLWTKASTECPKCKCHVVTQTHWHHNSALNLFQRSPPSLPSFYQKNRHYLSI